MRLETKINVVQNWFEELKERVQWSSESWRRVHVALALCPQALILQPSAVHLRVLLGGIHAASLAKVKLRLALGADVKVFNWQVTAQH